VPRVMKRRKANRHDEVSVKGGGMRWRGTEAEVVARASMAEGDNSIIVRRLELGASVLCRCFVLCDGCARQECRAVRV
jgi:hypothetical protein